MFSTNKKAPLLLFIFFTSLLTLNGCDKIKGLFQKKAPVPAPVAVSQPQPQSQPSSTPTQPTVDNSKNDEPLTGNTLAQVGTWTITADEFKQRLIDLKEVLPNFDPKNEDARRQVLEELIRQQLLVIHAERLGTGNDKEIQSSVEEFRKSLLVQKVATDMTKDIKATEPEAKDYYEKNKAEFIKPIEWHVHEIVVYTQITANEILAGLLQGGDFAEAAKTRSKSKSAPKSGDLGFVKDEEIAFPEMKKILETLGVGQTSGVFKGPEGFYIVKLEAKKGGEAMPYSEVKDDLTKALTLQKQQEEVFKILNDIAAKTTVKVNEDLLK